MLPAITTDRLILRPWNPDDVDTLHAIWADADVRRYLWDDIVITREQTAEVVASHFASVASLGIGYWVIQTSHVIGFCRFRIMEGTSEIELLYALLPHFWGLGFATEASQAALDYVGRNTPFKRVWARTDTPNEKSAGVMRRLGMRHDSSTPAMVTCVIERRGGAGLDLPVAGQVLPH